MKILVPIKVVHDPEQRVEVVDGRVEATGGLIMNPFDEYAVETALRLTEKGPKGERTGTVTVVSIGDPDEVTKPLRNAIAMGCDEGMVIEADEDALDGAAVARILASVVRTGAYDLVLMGKQSVEGDAGVVPGYLAGLLGWPQAMFAAVIEWNGETLVVEQEWDQGTVRKKIPLPAVVSVDLRIVAPDGVRVPGVETGAYPDGPRYASMKGQLKARKAKIPVLKARELAQDLGDGVRYAGHGAVERSRERKIVTDPSEFIKRFFEMLGDER